MKLRALFFICLTVNSLFSFSQITDKNRISDFNKLEILGHTIVTIVPSDTNNLLINGINSLNEEIDFKIENGTLTLVNTKGAKSKNEVVIEFRNLKEIKIADEASIKNYFPLVTDSLTMVLAGKSKADLRIITKKISVTTLESSKLVLSGASDTASFSLFGASVLNSLKMSTNVLYVNSKSNSNAKISVNEALFSESIGFSKIYYSGNPAILRLNKAESGIIEKLDETNLPVAGNGRSDTTTLNIGKKKYIIIDEESDNISDQFEKKSKIEKKKISTRFKNWIGLELAFNYWMNAKFDARIPDSISYLRLNNGLKSSTWNLNLCQHNFHLYKNYLNLVTGLGFSFQSYGFKNKIRLDADSTFTYYFSDSLKNFSRNKLKINYFSIPIFFEYNSSKNPKKSFHFAAGLVFNFRINSKTKRNFEVNGFDFKEIRKDEYNLNSFRSDASVRIGYRRFTAFTSYSLQSIFAHARGPVTHPFMVGLRILPLF